MKVIDRRVRSPSPAMLVAAVALTFALAGSAIAGSPVSKLTTKKVRAIANQEIDARAPGLSVAKAVQAEKATSATTATKADTASRADTATKADTATDADFADEADFSNNAGLLDNLNSSQFLRRDVCQAGTVLGFARFDPATMPVAPAYSNAGVQVIRNCGGGTAEASRVGVGDYRIRFTQLGAFWAVCTVLEQGDTPVRADVSLSLIGSGNWRVAVTSSTTDLPVDQRFVCIVV